MNTKNHLIVEVKPGSIAEETGIEPGDRILTISGSHVADLLDYIEKVSNEEFELEIVKPNGEVWSIEIEKDDNEDLGIIFGNRIMDIEKECENSCVFCFVDQLPGNMRSTLYLKDDDWRLSFIMGNYVTLTNLAEHEMERIVKERISPMYISVHSTNPSIREEMMRNHRAVDIMEQLRLFKEAGITVHCQIVVCPGINDGEVFEKTIFDLLSLWPTVQSVAAVPVGLTNHRKNLYRLKAFDPNLAMILVGQVEKWQNKAKEKYGTSFVFAADELYLLSELPMPTFSEYEDFPQLENGVGLVAKLIAEFEESLAESNLIAHSYDPFSIATGVLAYPVIKRLATVIENRFGVKIAVYPIRNRFFGELVTVAGLITGKDLLEELKDKQLGSRLLIPASMLRAEGDLFLDDLTPADIEKGLNVPVVPVEVSGSQLLKTMLDYKE